MTAERYQDSSQNTLGELAEIAATFDDVRELRGVTGLHPREQRAKYAARARQSAYLTRYMHRLDDVAGMDTPIRRARAAKRHPYTFSALCTGKEVIGSYDHLDDILYREAREHVDDAERDRLVEIEGDIPPVTPIQAAAQREGISRTTEWRRRKRAA